MDYNTRNRGLSNKFEQATKVVVVDVIKEKRKSKNFNKSFFKFKRNNSIKIILDYSHSLISEKIFKVSIKSFVYIIDTSIL